MAASHKSLVADPVKVVLLGDSGVGKSSIVARFVTDKFDFTLPPTLGAMYASKSLDFSDLAFRVNFQIWDTAGQEKYHCLTPIYYQDAAAAILTYDTTCAATFDGVKRWIAELQEKGPANIIAVIVGNKSDLLDSQQIDPKEAVEYAQKVNASFLLVSAKAGTGINEIFATIAQRLKNNLSDFAPDGGGSPHGAKQVLA